MFNISASINNTIVDNISSELRLGIGISRTEENKRRIGSIVRLSHLFENGLEISVDEEYRENLKQRDDVKTKSSLSLLSPNTINEIETILENMISARNKFYGNGNNSKTKLPRTVRESLSDEISKLSF